jgi:hypothetical protein
MDLARVFEAASEQHGALSQPQLRGLGVSAKAQRRAVSAGWLIVAAPGVVDVAGGIHGARNSNRPAAAGNRELDPVSRCAVEAMEGGVTM